MLDHTITIKGWQAAWLNRTLPVLYYYINSSLFVLPLTVIALSVAAGWMAERGTREIAEDPNSRPEVTKKTTKGLLKVTRTQFFLAVFVLFQVVALGVVDAVICAFFMGEDAAAHPETWDAQLLVETAIYVVYLVALFVVSFFLVPLLQMVLITWALIRFNSRHGDNALPAYIPVARYLSTYAAELWSMLLYFQVAFWAPTEGNSTLRFLILHACFGSALAWLEASFVFNFCANRIDDDDLAASNGSMNGILRMFVKTANNVVHVNEKSALLPRYEVPGADGPIPVRNSGDSATDIPRYGVSASPAHSQ